MTIFRLWLAGAALMFLVLMAAGTNVEAQEANQDAYNGTISKLIDSTRQQAKSLTDRHAAIGAALDRIAKDPKGTEIAKVLQETVDAANNALSIFGPENEIWKQHAEVLKIVDERIKNAQSRLNSDVRWAQIQKDWQTRRDELEGVRTNLLKQRDAAKARLGRIIADRDLITEQLRLAQVDAAIAELTGAAQEMESMSNGLQSILDQLQRLNPGA
jgi:hypothetical protein